MPISTERIQRLHKLIWLLIYLGLFGVVIGVVIRHAAPIGGHVLIASGLLAAAAGFVLIYVRSRMDEEKKES
jgi:hypothetical protein